MRISCHINFDGQCEEAFHTYKRVLEGRLQTLLRFGESPIGNQVPEEWQSRILHATLLVGENELLGSDVYPGQSGHKQGFSVTISIADLERAKSIFAALGAGGSILMPLQETFWAQAFGVVTDKYGVSWEINCPSSNSRLP
jgi:PhnB protein